MIGIGLALVLIPYEDNRQLVEAVNISKEIEYIFSRDRWINISR